MTAHAPIFCPVSDFIVIVEGNIPTSKTAEYTHKKYLARETGTYVTLPLMTAKHDCRRPRQCSYILHKPILASMPSIPSAKIEAYPLSRTTLNLGVPTDTRLDIL